MNALVAIRCSRGAGHCNSIWHRRCEVRQAIRDIRPFRNLRRINYSDMAHPAEFRPITSPIQRTGVLVTGWPITANSRFYRVADQLGRATWRGFPDRSGDHEGFGVASLEA